QLVFVSAHTDPNTRPGSSFTGLKEINMGQCTRDISFKNIVVPEKD
ncbi:1349_t:CDS:1, partial [Gigaspora margarita]